MDLKVKNNPQFRQGYLYAIRLLAASKKSESELSSRLRKKGYPLDIIGQVIGELKAQGILSDQKLVRETVQLAMQAGRYGHRRISFELKKRGVDSREIEKALEAYPKAQEHEIAVALAQERWGKLQKVEPKKRTKRLFDFLVNRGFNFELAREVVNQMRFKVNENL